MAKTNPMRNLRIAARVYKLSQELAESHPETAIVNLKAAINTTEETLAMMKAELRALESENHK